ncbi:polysaccharide deacetylase family protein [Halovivax gelatinilyticus]|uniref:polysaccharide deacetylase family protein n=1 Tax=Halovivax gelatinilyticus TaxID=2961597 RepID=UPI0020CA6539|nr:polysaccharide deacetylase family protein [Halovivax gelatinilyticus]
MGSVVISIDAELGWGFHDLESPPNERIERARWGWQTTRALLDAHEIPATWAVVGHLMLESCDGIHEAHPAPEGWFERERTEWRSRRDLRFGPDLVESLVESPVDHEIASHSFSHVLFDDPGTTSELARAECERAVELADAWNLSLDSFVFPRNGVGHRDALADAGFIAYRSRTDEAEGLYPVVRDVLSPRSMLVTPRVDEYGLVDVPPSLFAFGFEDRFRRIAETVRDDPMVELARRGIDQAATGDGIFHLWFHPNNVTTAADSTRLRRILTYVSRRRADGSLSVETMGQVGRRVLETSDESVGTRRVGPT